MSSVIAGASPAEAIKYEVLERIRAQGGEVRGSDFAEIRQALGFEAEQVSLRALRSALWKLTRQEGLLRFAAVRDWIGCDPRCYPSIEERIYKLA